MSRLKVLFLLSAVLLFGTCPMFAAKYGVGTCEPSLPSYPNISAAVSSVPAGSTVLVCPGTYAEQVIIAQPLTLQGVSSGNSAQAVITVPGGGLATITSIFGQILSPQVEVTTGPVNITNITVDGTGGSNSCSTFLVGIYYGSGSSGTVNEDTVRNEIDSGCGYGIWIENGTAMNESVTIENNSVHAFDADGILAQSNQSPPTLTATIRGNYVDAGSSFPYGIYVGVGALGSVTDNIVILATDGFGILSRSPVIISGNTLTGPSSLSSVGIGIQAAGVSVTGNKISNNGLGIDMYASGNTVKSNTIAKSNVGIEFNCTSGNTVSGNTINDAATGLDGVPLSSTPGDSFSNVATIRNDDCGFARSDAKSPPSPFNHHPN